MDVEIKEAPNLSQPMDNLPQSVYPTPRFLSKKLALVTLGLIAIIIAGGIYFASKQLAKPTLTTANNSIASWKTYSNPTLGVSFSYPSDVIRAQDLKDKVRLIKGSGYIFEVAKDDTSVGIDQALSQSGIKIDDYDVSVVELNSYAATIYKMKQSKYANYQVPSNFYALSHGDSTYIVTFEVNNDIANKVLSTFKFTDQNSSTDSSPKTYTNSQYGFSISYPSNFTLEDESDQFLPFFVSFKDTSRTFLDEGGTKTNSNFRVSARKGSTKDILNNPGDNLTFIKQERIGNNVFTIAHETHGIEGIGDDYLIDDGDYVLDFASYTDQTGDPQMFSVFLKALSTLKLTR